MLSIISVGAVLAQDYAIDWHTVDGGGEMWSIGGDYELGGTIGQPDAGIMSGGTYSLTGGLWVVGLPSCACPGDVNGDGLRNGLDIQAFGSCLGWWGQPPGAGCECADTDGDGLMGMNDVYALVDLLLLGMPCP
jgi:hypothetical protein